MRLCIALGQPACRVYPTSIQGPPGIKSNRPGTIGMFPKTAILPQIFPQFYRNLSQFFFGGWGDRNPPPPPRPLGSFSERLSPLRPVPKGL